MTANKTNDIIAGIVVALVSIPIAMGYAQIAGLPAVYGLYGSVLPIIIYGLITSSKHFIVGVDAMPAAMVGGLLAEMGVMGESEEAFNLVPIISVLVAVWFLLFYAFKAGRLVKYISSPVMGGFISGVGVTIIFMQIPKLFGGSPGTGEIFVLLANITRQLDIFNPIAFLLGFGTVVIILVCKKIIPKIPMTVIMLFVGAILQLIFHLENYGVVLLKSVEPGLPKLIIPKVWLLLEGSNGMHITQILFQSLSIAAVIMAQTLLASGNYASKYSYKLNNNRELLSYSAMNFAGAVSGCCPINGSVSRSGLADSFGMKSQLASITAGVFMILILLFATPYFGLLPVPVLTGIVITALIGIIDFKMIKRLWAESRRELTIFVLSFAGVLIFGTVNGVIIGCLLSFSQVALRAVVPPTAFIGRIPGRGNFYPINRNKEALPIKNTVIYRFSGNLFFANIDRFIQDIENAIETDGDNKTRQVVVDARAIGNIDITAIDRLIAFDKNLNDRGIGFYIAEHDGALNDQIKRQGGYHLLENGVCRRTITLALRDAGLEKPYDLVGGDNAASLEEMIEADDRLAEFEWAFGHEAEEHMERLARQTAEMMAENIGDAKKSVETLEAHGAITNWGMLGLYDEQEFWDHLEFALEELQKEGKLSKKDTQWLEERIENRRLTGEKRLTEINPHALEILRIHREPILEHLKNKNRDAYEHLKKYYEK